MTFSPTDFELNNYIFSRSELASIKQNLEKENYPVVYILYDTNSKQAYIGESTNILSRISNHLVNPSKKKLSYIYIVSSQIFNKSAALDIESNLIKYISADGHFQLLNGNAGLADHEYYQRRIYFDMFENIWDKLKLEKIVRKQILDIDNSDLFKYSPYKSLSFDQETAINKILNIILSNQYGKIFIEGSAGTGKTILAVYLIKLLITDFNIDEFDNKDTEIIERIRVIQQIQGQLQSLRIAMVVPMASLRKTLKKVFKNIRGLSSGMVIGPSEVTRNEYDILVVDEAHRLRRRQAITNYGSFDESNRRLGLDQSGTELDWILMNSKFQIFFYDAAQSIKPSDIPAKRFNKEKTGSYKLKLTSQFRVKAGDDYVKFVHNLFQNPSNRIIYKASFENYDIRLFSSLSEMIKKLEENEKEFGLARLMAGYSWDWVSRKDKDRPDAVIDDIKLYWNRVPQDWINSQKSLTEMGCIHTVQGYDLNYAGVIFGKEISYDPKTKSIKIHREHYHDSKGKSGISNIQELKEYIFNIYKTLLLRGMKGCYIYCVDKNLHNYIAQFLK